MRWLRPNYQIPRFGSAREKAEQIEAELAPMAEAATKPAFPSGELEQTIAVIAMLARAEAPMDAAALAARFRQGKRVEKAIAAVLAAAARTGEIATLDGRRFALRRAA